MRSRVSRQELLPTSMTVEEELELDLLLKQVYGLGPGPLEPEAIKRQPYDRLYLKQKQSRDYWSLN